MKYRVGNHDFVNGGSEESTCKNVVQTTCIVVGTFNTLSKIQYVYYFAISQRGPGFVVKQPVIQSNYCAIDNGVGKQDIVDCGSRQSACKKVVQTTALMLETLTVVHNN